MSCVLGLANIANFQICQLEPAGKPIRVQRLPTSIASAGGAVVTRVRATAKGLFREAVDAVKSIGQRIWVGVGRWL